jgi:DNA topoisomerase-1
VEINAGQGLWRANGQVMVFPGFTAVYVEGKDDGAPKGPQDGGLPKLVEGQELTLKKMDPKQHFTQPPPRFTEASLVR